mgnify:CR=1 FL=1
MWKSNPFISELVGRGVVQRPHSNLLATEYDNHNIWITLYHNFCEIFSVTPGYSFNIKYDTTYEEAKSLLDAYLQSRRQHNGNFSFFVERDKVSIYKNRVSTLPEFRFISRWYDSLGMVTHTERAISVIESMKYSISDSNGELTPDEFIAIFDSRMSLTKRAN